MKPATGISNFENATIEDIQANPSKYGAPTFAEFRANPDRYRKKREHAYVQIDQGATGKLTYWISTQKYFVEVDGKRFETKSLEKAQEVAHNEGITEDRLEWISELIPVSGTKAEVHVTLKRKSLILMP